MTRFSALRLCQMNKLVFKEQNDPCIISLKPSDPLSDAQLRRLVLFDSLTFQQKILIGGFNGI